MLKPTYEELEKELAKAKKDIESYKFLSQFTPDECRYLKSNQERLEKELAAAEQKIKLYQAINSKPPSQTELETIIEQQRKEIEVRKNQYRIVKEIQATLEAELSLLKSHATDEVEEVIKQYNDRFGFLDNLIERYAIPDSEYREKTSHYWGKEIRQFFRNSISSIHHRYRTELETVKMALEKMHYEIVYHEEEARKYRINNVTDHFCQIQFCKEAGESALTTIHKLLEGK